MATVPATVRALPRPQVEAGGAVRLVALAGLALYGAMHWATLLRPAARGDMLLLLVVALAGGLALNAIAALEPPRRRRATTAGTGVVLVALVLLAAGVPLTYLRPDHWDDLATVVANAVAELPGIRVPYRGTDAWVRIVLIGCGGLLLTLAAILALRPRPRSLGAAVVLAVLYAVPVVERGPDHPWLDGAVFALLLGGMLLGDRLGGRGAPLAAALAVVAVLAGALVAPRVDGGSPWIDYEALAEKLQGGASETFSWDHTYKPLTWPRDGLELARVTSRGPLYLKTTNLEQFDGTDWTQARFAAGGDLTDTEYSRRHPEWRQRIHVSIKGLKTPLFVGAGTTLSVSQSTKDVASAVPGTFKVTGKPLRRGDSYDAEVYYAQPSALEMQRVGIDYPSFVVDRQLDVDVPGAAGGRSVELQIAPWGSGRADLARFGSGEQPVNATAFLAGTTLAQAYTLAQELRAGSADPADYIQHVIARVQRDARYTETPPSPGNLTPLNAFLFRDHAGYCQHFAGATALLLRLGGVPARVASGFAPGSTNGNQHIIRDLDAHSWVEAYFPHLGWVTFDPTPGDSPAREQLTDTQDQAAAETPSGTGAAQGSGGVLPLGSGATSGASSTTTEFAGATGGVAWWPFAVAGGLVAALAGLLLLPGVLHRRRMARNDDPELEELRLALVRSGRDAAPNLTLQRVERLLGGSSYVRALRLSRYGAGAAGPSPRDRRLLRRELREGLGLRGWVRAQWALPPTVAEVRDALRGRHGRPYIG
jgi:transglutaminase-like putative cysteine protease